MNFDEFIESIRQQVSDVLGADFSIESRKVTKNNSVEYVCLVISESGRPVSPGIYLNSFFLEYINGSPIKELADRIIGLYHEHKEFGKEGLLDLINKENISDRIFVKLVNYERNKAFLENAPYERIYDLAVTYHYLLSSGPDGISSIKMDNTNCTFFGITHEEMKKTAFENTEKLFPAIFQSLNEELKTYPYAPPAPPIPGLPSLYILSNRDRYNGAACLLYKNILERIQKSINSDFYILPSSVNEALIVPEALGSDEEYLKQMVSLVNRNYVPETEFLSDNIYHYPGNSFTAPDRE
ncbi:MAG: hypothetical protein J5783_05850 [Lachnospiraceae bacterium]|nr:hypothetical protein [Lachnospiraceae bacterium]